MVSERRKILSTCKRTEFAYFFFMSVAVRPIYESKSGDALGFDSPSAAELEALAKMESAKKTRRGQSCWNCESSEHAIADCPEDRDQRRINTNKRKFQIEKEASM